MSFTDLLSSGDHAEIRSALSDVSATVDKTIITYKRLDAIRDRFNEDRDSGTYTIFNIPVLLEFGIIRDNDRFEITTGGSKDRTTARLTINVDRLVAMNLWDDTTNLMKAHPEKDYLIIQGRDYNIVQLAYDGSMEAKPILVVIYADPRANRT